MAGSVFDAVVGQHRAVELLRRAAAQPSHAYLFVGPAGATKRSAARALATVLISGSDDADGRDARLIMEGKHRDVREVERVGPAIDIDQARDIVHLAALAPVESARKVVILQEFHLARPDTAAALLKTIEEPPESTTFVVLVEAVTPELTTIASRCARIDFHAIAETDLIDQLVLEGVDPDSAAEAAAGAGGSMPRARLLANDPEVTARRRAFAAAPRSLDGTGATVMRLGDELRALIDAALAPLKARHAEEVAALNELIRQFGERGSGAKALEDRHKREMRRYRTDLLREGLTQMALTYRGALTAEPAPARPEAVAEAVHRIHTAMAALDRNPNEALWLQSLLWSLPSLAGLS